MTDRSRLFISTEDLAARLGAPKLRILDASWYLPTMPRDAHVEYEIRRIPGAVYFDIDAIADTATDLPHMLPDAATFGRMAGALGLSGDDEIVVYDGAGLMAAPRVWWTLITFGATDVRILEGGLPKWMDEGRELDKDDPRPPTPAIFEARLDAARIVDMAGVAARLADGAATVIDARPGERFRAEAPEPREGIPAGHMAGARSIPAASVIAGTVLAPEETLRAVFAELDTEKPVVCSCGSGVTAAILWLALEAIGVPAERMSLYDGSWSEWATRGGAVVTGA